MDIASILTAGGAGGVFGILGQIANRGIGIFEAREHRKDLVLSYEQEQKRWGHEADLLKLQMQAKQEETEQELSLADAKGAWEGFTASQTAESSIGHSYPWVEAVRALTRPVLTLEAQVLLALVFFAVKGSERAELVGAVVDTVTFTASASLLWWFGERAERKSRAK